MSNPMTEIAPRLTVQCCIDAPLAQVWQCYTSPAAIMQWNAASEDWHTTAATVDLRVGGQFCSRMAAKDGSMAFDFAGTYTAVEPEALLAYEFGGRHAEVRFSRQASTKPEAQAVQSVLVQVQFDAETVHSLELQQAGWQSILDNFKRYVEAQ